MKIHIESREIKKSRRIVWGFDPSTRKHSTNKGARGYDRKKQKEESRKAWHSF